MASTTHENEIILYQPNKAIQLEVRLKNETVWLNRQQMSDLFGRDIKTIGKHINNALQEELFDFSVTAKFAATADEQGLEQTATIAKFAIVQTEGGRQVERMIEFYSLDVILSVGYRVKSQQGIQFRIWANRVLKDYLLKGYAVNQRFERLEKRVSKTEEKIDFFVKTALPPTEGIFYEGQIFDAYTFASDLVKSAKKSIVLIDNYIDESVLILLSKRVSSADASIYTAQISQQLQLDIQKHNSQYPKITIKTFKRSHDRFLIIDDTVYHIGASLKDLGKKWFAFSKMILNANELLSKIK